MAQTNILIRTNWNEVNGTYGVLSATARGFGMVKASTREAFNDSVARHVPQGTDAIILYDDAPVTVHGLRQ